jgi:hypothetical protein
MRLLISIIAMTISFELIIAPLAYATENYEICKTKADEEETRQRNLCRTDHDKNPEADKFSLGECFHIVNQTWNAAALKCKDDY